jgi:hypothetical protein
MQPRKHILYNSRANKQPLVQLTFTKLAFAILRRCRCCHCYPVRHTALTSRMSTKYRDLFPFKKQRKFQLRGGPGADVCATAEVAVDSAAMTGAAFAFELEGAAVEATAAAAAGLSGFAARCTGYIAGKREKGSNSALTTSRGGLGCGQLGSKLGNLHVVRENGTLLIQSERRICQCACRRVADMCASPAPRP